MKIKLSVSEIAEILSGSVEGDASAEITSFARIEYGKPGAISFFANPKYEHYVYTSKSTAILVNRDFQPSQPVSATLIRVENAYSAVAALLDYVTKKTYKRYRGLRSRIRCSARLGKKVYVGDFSYIGKKAVVGDCTKIYEQVFIGDNVKIGDHCIIYPGVKIYPDTVIGNRVILQAGCVIGSDGFGFAPQPDGSYRKIEHTGNVIIEDDVEIGANTTVDKSQMGSTIIHKGVKLDNLIQIAHNVEVGSNTVMAAMVGVAGSARIGERCVIGGQVGIVGHISVADNTTVAAQSGIFGAVKTPGQTLLGTPAIPRMNYLRSYALFKKAGEDKKK